MTTAARLTFEQAIGLMDDMYETLADCIRRDGWRVRMTSETDTGAGPERIWRCRRFGVIIGPDCENDGYDEYIRADLVAALEAERNRAMNACEQMGARFSSLEAERDAACALADELDFLYHEGGEASIAREIERARAEGYRQGIEDAAQAAERVGRPVGAGDGDTYICGSSADAARA